MEIFFEVAYFEGLGKQTKKNRIILDGIRPQTHLNYHTILFCFASELEIFSALFILSHSYFYIVQITRSLCKVHEINEGWRWVETVKGTCHAIKKYADFDKFYIVSF
jgi:hypothetical protein